MEVNCLNCPRCRNGVLEKTGEINLTPDISKGFYPAQFNIAKDNTPFRLTLFVCSLNICGYADIKANEEFLPMLNKEKYRLFMNDAANN